MPSYDMTAVIGADLGPFKSGLNEAEGMMKKAGSRLGTAMGGIGKVAQVGFKAAALGVTALGGALTGSLMAYGNYEKALNNVATLVDTSVVDVKELGKGIMALPSSLGPATDNVNALYQALSAGVAPAESVKFVGEAAMAAKAGLTDAFTAVDAGTSVLNAFGLETADAGRIFDEMFKTVEQGKTTFPELAAGIGKIAPIAAAAGLSTSAMFAGIAALTKGGLATREAVTYLRQALANVIKPGEEAVKMAESLGLEFNATALKTKGLQGFMMSVREATGGNIETMAKLFGSVEALNAVMALTGGQAKDFAEAEKAIADSAGAVNTAFEKQRTGVLAMLEEMWTSIKKVAIIVGEKLAPYFKEVVGRISEWVTANQDLIGQKFEEYLKLVVDWTTEAWRVFKEDLVPVLKVVWDLLKEGIGWVDKWGGTVGVVMAAVGVAFMLLIGPVGWIALTVGAIVGLYAAWQKNFGDIQEKTKKFVAALGNLFSGMRDTIKKVWGNLTDWIKNKLDWILGAWGKAKSVLSWVPGMGGGGDKPGLQHGTPYVPETGIYRLHKGEAIIPAAQNPFSSNTTNNNSYHGSPITVNLNVTGGPDQDWNAITRRQIIPAIKKAIKYSGVRLN